MTLSGNHFFRTSTAMTLGASLVVTTPFLFSRPAIAQRTFFTDVSNSYWAKPFIERLVKEGVINGYSDGTFKPEQTVTRAQFSVILQKAFSEDPVRKSRTFKDVPAKHPAAAAISKAYTTGFMSGFSDNTFRPNAKITKAQTIVYLASGLQLDSPNNADKILSMYRDANEIPAGTQNGIAAATEKGLVVNYPKVTYLNPTDEATRAEVAATVYQALVSQGKLPALTSTSKSASYIVKYDAKGQSTASTAPNTTSSTTTPNGTSLQDVADTYWAKPFIERLVKDNIINGYSDGTFKPEQTVTRAELSVILQKAFSEDPVRKSRTFSDVPANHSAAAAIDKAYTTGFVSGYSDNTFRPDLKVTKAQTLVYLANGLQFDTPSNAAKTLSMYRDANEIPEGTQNGIAAATEKGLVVNHPKVTYLNPTDEVTRAEVAAIIYQALVNKGKLPALASTSKALDYVVKYDAKAQLATSGTTTTPNDKLIARGTAVSVKFPGGSDVKLIVAPSDTVVTNFEVAQSILDSKGKTLIPAGSQIQGRFQPTNINGTPGTQYVADKLIMDGKFYPINLASDPLSPTPKQAISTGSLSGSLATMGARLLLGRLFGGGIDLGSVLGGVLGGGGNAGSALGGLLGSGDPASSGVVVVEPSKLVLKLQNDFTVAQQFGDRPLVSSAQNLR
jgi:hypothetical protein